MVNAMSTDGPSSEVTVVKGEEPAETNPEALEHPAKVMRIGAMVRNLLEEVRQSPLDDASRDRLRDIYETSVKELGEVLSPELRDELNRLSTPFDDGIPSQSELRVAHAQLVGWLEGLFHGIQAMLFAQQQENLARLEELRRRGLPSGEGSPEVRPGTYL
ncbi:MAG TPA: proteasome activator [Actinomycetota bacterium]|jgi:hypothetical protein|nr:proteasome activator [Actinomycetota bacterium]